MSVQKRQPQGDWVNMMQCTCHCSNVTLALVGYDHVFGCRRIVRLALCDMGVPPMEC